MANNIYGGGPTQIFSSTATGAGSWYRVHPSMSNLTFQAVMSGSAASTAVGGAAFIEVSNDGSNACETIAGTITFGNSAASTVVGTRSDGFSMDAGWQYVRANSSTISSGVSGFTVYVSGWQRSV